MHVELEFLTDGLDVLESFLIVWSSATDPDLDFVLIEQRRDFPEGTNDALEGRSDLQKWC